MGEPLHPRAHQFINFPSLGKFYFNPSMAYLHSRAAWYEHILCHTARIDGHHGTQVLMSLTVLHPGTPNSVTQVKLCEN